MLQGHGWHSLLSLLCIGPAAGIVAFRELGRGICGIICTILYRSGSVNVGTVDVYAAGIGMLRVAGAGSQRSCSKDQDGINKVFYIHNIAFLKTVHKLK